MSTKTNASRRTSECRRGAATTSTVQFSACAVAPARCTKSKYASTVPTNASAMPTDPIRMYFQEASTEALLILSGTTIADTIVVASIATHISPTLSTLTATNIVKANRFENTMNRRAWGAVQPSLPHIPGPSHAASAETTAIDRIRTVDSA